MIEDQEVKMFGMTINQMEVDFARLNGDLGFLSSKTMYAMQILSDVQEIIHSKTYGDKTDEVARQWLNKAKYFIGDVHHELRKTERRNEQP